MIIIIIVAVAATTTTATATAAASAVPATGDEASLLALSAKQARRQQQQCTSKWPTVTDSGGKTYATFKVDVNMNMAGKPEMYCPDECYTSIYGYSRTAQAKVNSNTANWNGYEYTETQQFVYTNTELLSEFDFNIQVDTGDAAVQMYQVSFLGNQNGDFKSQFYISADVAKRKGFLVPWSKIADATFKPPDGFGSYAANPIHLSIIPLDGNMNLLGKGLVVFIAGVGLPQCNPGAWCSGRPTDEICCYLKADDSTDNTLQPDFLKNYPPKYKGLSNSQRCWAGEEGFKMPEDAGNDVVTSTLNALIKSNPGKSIRIVVDPKTTVNFPISNYWRGNGCDTQGKVCYEGYDTAPRVAVDGFGRINGFYAQATPLPTMTLYQVWARLAWISGRSSTPTSGSGWNSLLGGKPFRWANGEAGGLLTNDGAPGKYSVQVTHVQFGYGTPIGDAPVTLGDYRPGGYGAASLTFDVKFISFSTTSDGISMRDPASYAKANFIHGSDDLMKTVTGVPGEVTWAGLAVTFFAGFDKYGSLSCPCCFGPTGGFHPTSVYFCKNILVSQVLVPLIFAPNPSEDCYSAPGLIAPKWGVKCGEELVFPIRTDRAIAVSSIRYEQIFIVFSKFNYVQAPLVNWMMQSNNGQAQYRLEGDAVRFTSVFSDVYLTPSRQRGYFVYNWGTNSYSAEIIGQGTISTEGTTGHMAPDFGPCSSVGGDYYWAPCPTVGNGINVLTPKDAANCAAYPKGSVTPVSYGTACGALGKQLNISYPTASLYGDRPCRENLFCGLRFESFKH